MRAVVLSLLLCLELVVFSQGFVTPSNNRQPTFTSSSPSSFVLQASVTDNCDVAVFGGGFGGLYTALAVSRDAKRQGQDLDVVLVEPTDSFVFLPLLYDLTVGTATEAEVCPSYADLLRGTGVRHVRASLESLCGEDRSAELRLCSVKAGDKADADADTADICTLLFSAGVVAVGASPASILASVPGASEYAQPFYTAPDAKKTRRLLNRLEEKMSSTTAAAAAYHPRIAVVGGGFGGVEMAASVQRRLSTQASVTLLTRGRPMAGTRAEPLVEQALQKLGVTVEECTVAALEQGGDNKVFVRRTHMESGEVVEDDKPWDIVFWTAGSRPSDPVSDGCQGLQPSPSGRLAVDPTLRCVWGKDMMVDSVSREGAPRVWALGDCAEVVYLVEDKNTMNQPVFPKTAQVAMQQAETVAGNILAQLKVTSSGRSKSSSPTAKTFEYQDLGSMLTLGGPNGAVLAPSSGAFEPIFAPLLDTAAGFLGVADGFLSALSGRSPVLKELGLSPETLGLSLGSHGLGVDDGGAPGTLAGTLTGAARRTVYAVRMPTNQQRAVSLLSATIYTAAALAKEASDRNKKLES
jgi:NADH:ubiquinone reductase (non-electrogenic)